MEEFGPTPTQVEETPTQRRRFLPGKFLDSWLDKLKSDDDDDEETDKKKSNKTDSDINKTESKAEETDWKPERLRDRFRKFFRGLVSLETVSDKTEESSTSSNLLEFNRYESLDSEPQPDNHQELISPKDEAGLLAVSDHAQRRYYGHEVSEDNVDDGAEALPEIEVNNVETEHPVEHDSGPDIIKQAATSEKDVSTHTVEPVGDVIRRSQEERLKRRVKRLRRQTRNMHHQQEDMKDKQSVFEDKLDANAKAQKKFQDEVVPKMEADRKVLRQRLEDKPEPLQVKFEIPTIGAKINEQSNQKVELKTEVSPQLVPKERPVKTIEKVTVPKETVKQVQEDEFEDDGYRETYYERRHEVMDNPAYADNSAAAYHSDPVQINNLAPPPIYKQATTKPHPVWTNKNAWSDFYHRISPKPGPDMYKQSAINGAVGGIIILVLLGLLTLVR